ncbi:MAG: CYTH domain-containing protein [Oleiphilaceae bacterium]|nr:CYTH domain-containing protein [Oleiphilaceae bacterium]
MPQEIETKLRVVQSALGVASILEELKRLLAVDEFALRRLRNIYFDTSRLLLNQHKVALRLREVEGEWLQTLKTQGEVVNGVHRRGEWEWPVTGKQLDVVKLSELAAWPKDVPIAQLQPVFETNFDRYLAIIDRADAKVELALDVGEIESNGRRDGIFEIELELVSGAEQVLFDLSNTLRQSLPVEAYDCSKAERGYALFKGK